MRLALYWMLCAAVIKPIFGAASLGVVRVNCQEDLLATYKKVKSEMNSVTVKDGAMMTGDPDAEEAEVCPLSFYSFYCTCLRRTWREALSCSVGIDSHMFRVGLILGRH